jgi:hypothetical protein
MKRLNNRGVSEVVTYVLLIVTAISLSIIVFGFLQGIVPEDEESCPAGLGLVINEVKCESSNTVYITFQNKGRFKIDGVYARFSRDEGSVASEKLMPVGDVNNDLNRITEENADQGFMYFGHDYGVPRPLSPNADPYLQLFSYASAGSLERIEIQPFLSGDDRNLIICEDKTISYEWACP